MIFIDGDHIIDVGAERQRLRFAAALDRHFDGKKGRVLDLDADLFGRRHEIRSPVVVFAQYAGK